MFIQNRQSGGGSWPGRGKSHIIQILGAQCIVFSKTFQHFFNTSRSRLVGSILKVYNTKRQFTPSLHFSVPAKTNYQPNANLRSLEKVAIIGILPRCSRR